MTGTSRTTMSAAPFSGMPALSRRRLLGLAIVAPVLVFAASGASAQSLNELRASGVIGERFDGYTVARSGAGSSVANSVNAERRKIYSQRAAQQGVSADQVGRVYARQIFGQAPGGTYFLQENGKWTRK